MIKYFHIRGLTIYIEVYKEKCIKRADPMSYDALSDEE